MFKPTAPKKPDTHRKARERAKELAALYRMDIEKCGSGFNVWPPHASFGRFHQRVEIVDEFDGDHYCNDWAEVLHMVLAYSGERA